MSKFHSTVSRRDFMKGIGLMGAGVGAAAATTPVFHDLDEVASATGATWDRPWWVSEKDHGDPTIEIDWTEVVRADWTPLHRFPYRSSQKPTAIYNREHYDEFVKDRINEVNPDWTGDDVRDIALNSACGAIRFYNYYGPANKTSFLGLQKVDTPEDNGLTKWTGEPEENLRMVRSAARLFGAMDVAALEIDANIKKLFFSIQTNGKTIEFEEVDQAYETDTKTVIPNKCKWLLVWTEVQPTELTMREPSEIGRSATSMSYTRIPQIFVQLQEFGRGLGYQMLGGGTGDFAPANPCGNLSGMGEHGRMCFPLISPEFGSMIRGMNRMVTDLPLSPTKPINAGINRFCKTCGICAEEGCPFDALPLGDQDWVSQWPEEDQIEYDAPGWKGWRLNTHKCTNCAACQAACPFNATKHAWLHDIVLATQSTTSLFNGFFASMEGAFSYGLKDPKTWWDIKNPPLYGIDPNFQQR